ncbi:MULTISPECIES: hypothetical protein [Bacillaceae]|uniref:Uncharacterized protein n=1 Tax=Metabacillus sediminis TaxID=3117746 RepID=A0ABZ2NFG4_9BACI|nr:hypothetical protein [Bacillus sp. SJS]KZZ82588.1 hypothetical protein AS29_020495 [Bacillus sp. SJS]
MSDMNPQEALALIKKTGTELERSINDTIQIQLNREELLNLVNMAAPFIKRAFDQSQEISEFLSVPLNFPTKRDFVRLANLSIQIEEKLDQIEGYLYQLANQGTTPAPSLPSTETPALIERANRPSLARSRANKEQLKQILMQHALHLNAPSAKETTKK